MSASISAGLGSHAAPVTMKWRGRTLSFKYLEWASVISQLENWLVKKALEFKKIGWDVLRESKAVDDEGYAKLVMDFVNDCNDNGTYSFGSEPMMKILMAGAAGNVDKGALGNKVFSGMVKLCSLLLGVSEDDAISLMADKEKSTELSACLALVMNRSHPGKEDAEDEESGGEPSGGVMSIDSITVAG